jgi:hypothetical protein
VGNDEMIPVDESPSGERTVEMILAAIADAQDRT